MLWIYSTRKQPVDEQGKCLKMVRNARTETSLLGKENPLLNRAACSYFASPVFLAAADTAAATDAATVRSKMLGII